MTTTEILLIGAGELGTAFLPPISSLPNIHITLGVRSPSNYSHLTSSAPNITPLALDITSPSLSATFSTFDILIIATGFAQSPASVLKLAREVLEAGRLKRSRGEERLWYFPWQWGVDYDVTGDGQGLMPLFGTQRDVRDLLRKEAVAANVKWSVVSTGIFMSFLFEEFWGVVEKGDEGRVVVRALRHWEHKVTVTDVHDIGRVLAKIVNGEVDAENKVVCVAGNTVSYRELAEIVTRVSGKEVEEEVWDVPYLEEEFRHSPDDGIKKYRLVFARDGVWWDKENTVNDKLGIEMMRVEDYAKNLFK